MRQTRHLVPRAALAVLSAAAVLGVLWALRSLPHAGTLQGLIVASEPYPASSPPMHIFTVRPDGTAKTILTDDRGNQHPSWSCDGHTIYYSSGDGGGHAQIWQMNADGSGKRQLTNMPNGAELPSVSCTGKLAFFSIDMETGNAVIYVMDSLASAPRALTSPTDFSWAPIISNDGTRVAFPRQLNHDANRELFVINADGSNERQLTFPDAANGPDANAPAWSPDGRQIAYYCGRESKPNDTLATWPGGNVCLMNADGSNQHVLTECANESCKVSDEPAWSPDGTHIMYDRMDVAGGQPVLHTYIMNADGSGQRPLFPFLYAAGRRPWRAAN